MCDFQNLPLSGPDLDDVFYVFAVKVCDEESVGKKKLIEGKDYYLMEGFTILEDRILVSKERYRKTVYDYYLRAKSVSSPHVSVSAIVGENGAGKSSLIEFEMRLINNFAAVVFGEYAKEDGRAHLHFIDGVSGELFYLLRQNVYRLSLKGRDVKLYCYYMQKGEEDGMKAFVNPSNIINGNPVPDDGKPISSVFYQSYYDSIKELLPRFFYTVVLNQSVYAYNTYDFQAECNSEDYEVAVRKGPNRNEKGEEIPYSIEHRCWLSGLFHKNDGYQIPIVLTPYRYEGNYDINDENRLAYERLVSIMVVADAEGQRVINGHLRVTSFDLKRKNNPYDLDYVHRKVGFSQFTEEDFAKMKDILLSTWSKIAGYKILENSRSFIYREQAINYLVYKTLKIAGTYDGYRDFYYRFGKKEEPFDAAAFELLVKQTIADYSHVTNKLYRTIAYLVWDIYEINEGGGKPVRIEIENLNQHWLKALKEKRLDIMGSIGSNITLEASIPPPFFEFTIGLVELKSGIYVPFEYLSSGEKQQAYTTSSIAYHLKNLNSVSKDRNASDRVAYQYVQLILEEVELYYHPELQRQFVKNLIDCISLAGLSNIKWVSICIVTHSPFVLSDIPSKNVLALKKDGGEVVHLPSFGANIHEMLKLSFFLENGAVGDFSRWTVNRIAKCLRAYRWLDGKDPSFEEEKDFLDEFKTFLNGMRFSEDGFKLVYPSEEILSQINLIEEPVVRRVLLDDFKRTFPEKKEEYKDSMRALLKKQMDALEKL